MFNKPHAGQGQSMFQQHPRLTKSQSMFMDRNVVGARKSMFADAGVGGIARQMPSGSMFNNPALGKVEYVFLSFLAYLSMLFVMLS